MSVKKLSLRPYHGEVWVCNTLPELHAAYKRATKKPYPYEDQPNGGRYVKIAYDDGSAPLWLVYARTKSTLAHELCHVLLQTFGFLGHDPTVGDGEPFCYMLSQLMDEAA